jgi:GAF domain-containing protein
VGTLCLGDRRPRDFSDDDRRTLEDLSALVEHELRRGAS